MIFFNKNVKYFKFFEDIKLLESDEKNKRLAIVFNGKESIINIFDSSPYVDYYPILEDKECDFSLNKTKSANNSNLSPAAKLSIGPIQEVDITKMFQKIQLSLTNPNNSDIVSKSFIGLPEPKIVNESNQTCIIYGNPFSEQVSINQKIKHNNILLFQITKFNIEYQPSTRPKKALLSLTKPKIKSKLLCVITNISSVIIKIKWFEKPINNLDNNDDFISSKLLLVIGDDGNISIFQLTNIDNTQITKVNLQLLQNQPFTNFIEEWKIIANTKLQIPLKDFYIIPSLEGKQYVKLFTLHFDNNIYFWYILFEGNKLKFSPSFCVSFDPNFLIESILVDKNENFLFCFNLKGIEIYKLCQTPPFTKIYTYVYEDSHAPLLNDTNNIYSDFSSEEIDEEIIDVNEKAYIEDVKFFKNTIQPCFICLEQKILIQIFNVSTSKFELLCLNCLKLWDVIKDINFFSLCVLGNDRTILKKIFESKYNFSYCVSPSLYYAPPPSENKIFLNMVVDLTDINQYLQQILFILNDDSYFFAGISLGGVTKNNTIVNGINNFAKISDESPSKILNIFDINEKERNLFFTKQEKDYKIVLSWLQNNTILFSSQKNLFYLLKYCNESKIFGIPISEEKLMHFLSKK